MEGWYGDEDGLVAARAVHQTHHHNIIPQHTSSMVLRVLRASMYRPSLYCPTAIKYSRSRMSPSLSFIMDVTSLSPLFICRSSSACTSAHAYLYNVCVREKEDDDGDIEQAKCCFQSHLNRAALRDSLCAVLDLISSSIARINSASATGSCNCVAIAVCGGLFRVGLYWLLGY